MDFFTGSILIMGTLFVIFLVLEEAFTPAPPAPAKQQKQDNLNIKAVEQDINKMISDKLKKVLSDLQ